MAPTPILNLPCSEGPGTLRGSDPRTRRSTKDPLTPLPSEVPRKGQGPRSGSRRHVRSKDESPTHFGRPVEVKGLLRSRSTEPGSHRGVRTRDVVHRPYLGRPLSATVTGASGHYVGHRHQRFVRRRDTRPRGPRPTWRLPSPKSLRPGSSSVVPNLRSSRDLLVPSSPCVKPSTGSRLLRDQSLWPS